MVKKSFSYIFLLLIALFPIQSYCTIYHPSDESKNLPTTTSYLLTNIDSQGNLVTIQDGSVWCINESDKATVKSWSKSSEVTLMPNRLSYWNIITWTKPQEKYRIVNLKTNESAAANLSQGSFFSQCHRIRKIDYMKGNVYFLNGALFQIGQSTEWLQTLKTWHQLDFVICGTNETSSYYGGPYIIINESSDNWLPATRIDH